MVVHNYQLHKLMFIYFQLIDTTTRIHMSHKMPSFYSLKWAMLEPLLH